MSASSACLAPLHHAILHCCDCVHVPGAVPLELAAAKSRGGHAETGAGAVGMRAAAMRLSYLGQLPLAHLRSLNTHVAQALDTANTVQWLAPRGPGGGFAGGCVASISAFAFQGTNAHAVLCRTAHAARERGGSSSMLLICSAAHLQRESLTVFAAQVAVTSPAGADSDSGMRRSHIGCCRALFQQAVAQMYSWRRCWICQHSHTSGTTRYVFTTPIVKVQDAW